MYHFCYIYFVFVMFSYPFTAALWSPAGKGAYLLTFLYVMFSCLFVTFSCGILGQVWYLIVSIPHLCALLTFSIKCICTLVYHLLKRIISSYVLAQ